MFDSMITQARGVAVSGLCRADLEGLVAGAGRVIAAMGALQARCATEIEALDDGGVNSKVVLREAGRMSTRAANKVAKTAAGLVEMPKLAESLAEGKITAEHVEVAVGAAAKTSPQQVEDQLSGLAEDCSVDAFTEESRRWVNRNQPDDGTELYEQQRKNRSLKHWINEEGMGVLFAELDPVSYQQVRKAIDVEYDRLWRDDGGRDGSPDDVRTTPQRMADAFVALLTNPERRGPGSTRMQLIAVADIERLRADNPTGVAEIVGGEALPRPCWNASCAPPPLPGSCSTVMDSPSGWDAPTDTQPKPKSKRSSPGTGTAEANTAPQDQNAAKSITSSLGNKEDEQTSTRCVSPVRCVTTTSTTAATSSSRPKPATKSSTPTTRPTAPDPPLRQGVVGSLSEGNCILCHWR